jgi:hypothetical protein
MKMKACKYYVNRPDGTYAYLVSDDSFTLAFGEYFESKGESTEQDLSEAITPESLAHLAGHAEDKNDRQKAGRALRIWLNANID